MYSDDEIEIARKNAQIEDQNLRASFDAADRAYSQSYNETLRDEIEDLQREVERLQGLLNSPMHVIAQKHMRFGAHFKADRKLLSSWIVSQKAFKEIAMEYAARLGIDREEVIRSGMDAREVILLGQSKFQNNIQPNTLAEDYAEALLADFYAERDKGSA
ncbi:hypothetical protein PCA20602_02700 [Pandoraea capi]|uniref:Uncharacterized protein n=1 Tax=Pandoraea capi TaxID=2508286 RepID=A0ABY6W0S6_9BURK|nr:hypothetical protein [Pandoraea capi]VVE12367.1 hypothetical protein PCA20602_02700 [Pandoraea capi]